jgi:hypothetical protein
MAATIARETFGVEGVSRVAAFRFSSWAIQARTIHLADQISLVTRELTAGGVASQS